MPADGNTEIVQLELPKEVARRIDEVARRAHTSSAEVMVEAIRQASEHEFADSAVVEVDAETLAYFDRVLGEAPDSKALARLAEAPRPWRV